MLTAHPVLPDDVLAARDGDAQAFARLVHQHAGMVTAIATAILGHPLAGEEVAQEVFVHAWQGLPSLRDPERFGPWLRQMTRNRAHDALRRRLRRKELQDDGVLDQLPDPSADAGDQLDEAQQEAALWKAFEALEQDDREVLALFHRQGGSARALAEQLGLSEPAVRKRLSRARARLRQDVMAALGARLECTAPGAAFVAAVVAALAPRPAQASTKSLSAARKTSMASLAAGCVLGMFLSLGWWCAPHAPPEGSLPAALRSERSSLGGALFPEILDAAEGSEQVPVQVSVRLGSWELPNGSLRRTYNFQPVLFWPQDAPFPDGEASAALLQASKESALSDEQVAQIEALQTDTLPDDPWAALVALEARRLLAQHAWKTADSAFEAQAEKIEANRPRPELAGVLALAQQVREAWPEHEVADYADLYVVNAYATEKADTWDPDALGDEVMAILRDNDDLPLRAAALIQLANASAEVRLRPEDLDVLGESFLDPDEFIMDRYAVTALAVESALAAGDLARAQTWMARHDQAAEGKCEELQSIEMVDLPNLFGRACALIRAARDNRSSWLSARTGAAPVSWQAALGAVVQRCGDLGLPLEEKLVGEGQFEDGWTWASWEGDAAFAACIAAMPSEGPTPPPGTAVRLEVLPRQ